MTNYHELDEFKDVLLEDSFVIGIKESEVEISFSSELVLRENHPMHRPPKIGEQHCYQDADIIFSNVRHIEWLEKNNSSFTDANGSVDYGNIDIFQFSSKGYYLEGDWGRIRISSDTPTIRYQVVDS